MTIRDGVKIGRECEVTSRAEPGMARILDCNSNLIVIYELLKINYFNLKAEYNYQIVNSGLRLKVFIISYYNFLVT